MKTEIRATLTGYQAGFQIGSQTFYLEQWDAESIEESKQLAEWQCEMLEKAFNKCEHKNYNFMPVPRKSNLTEWKYCNDCKTPFKTKAS